MLVGVTPRLYQETILANCIDQNVLVVLPTGMGKTIVALMLAVHRLKEHPGSKILVVSPTRPLVEQHARTFKTMTDIEDEKIMVFTGHTRAEKRAEQWKDAKIVFSTPQGLENDVMARRIGLEDVSLIVFDEAHRAVGDYAYVFLAKQYYKQAKNCQILALTASPGSDMEKIMEVVENLHIDNVEVKTPEDPDVKPYIQDVDFEWIKVDLPEEFKDTKTYLANCYKSKLEAVKQNGYLNCTSVNKMELLKLQRALHGMMARGDRSFEIMKSISLLAEAMKVEHAIELFESQGVSPTVNYLNKIDAEAPKSKTKAVKNLVRDINFRTALVTANNLRKAGIEHPKLGKLVDLVGKVVENDPSSKTIVFTQYRDSASNIQSTLESAGISARTFVGQSKKGGNGMSQKRQVELLDEFREGGFSVLVATSVAEEGLDIPKVDEVVFFEPIPSAIRSIQRRGRTGRNDKGSVKVLMAKGTRDEAYRWSSHHKEKRMFSNLHKIGEQLRKKIDDQTDLEVFVQKSNLKFYVDHRERGSGVMKTLLDRGVGLDLQQLKVGDYQLSTRVCVEFKTVPDFVNSIIDGRLMEQLIEMKRHFSRPLLVIQGTEDMYAVRQVHPNAIRGAMATIVGKIGVPVLQTRDALETAELLMALGKKEEAEYGGSFSPHGNKRPVTIKDKQEYLVGSLPGVGYGLSKPLLKKFGSIKKILEATEEELQEVEKIGTLKSKQIREVIDAEWKED